MLRERAVEAAEILNLLSVSSLMDYCFVSSAINFIIHFYLNHNFIKIIEC
jgi:hypothetical protein